MNQKMRISFRYIELFKDQYITNDVENKKQNMSFFDCVGYVYARENNIKFVTGDKEFEKKEGVLFIKK